MKHILQCFSQKKTDFLYTKVEFPKLHNPLKISPKHQIKSWKIWINICKFIWNTWRHLVKTHTMCIIINHLITEHNKILLDTNFLSLQNESELKNFTEKLFGSSPTKHKKKSKKDSPTSNQINFSWARQKEIVAAVWFRKLLTTIFKLQNYKLFVENYRWKRKEIWWRLFTCIYCWVWVNKQIWKITR